MFFEILIIFWVRGLNVFFFFTFFVFFWRKFTFCAQVTVLILDPWYLAQIILEFCSKGGIFFIFEFWPCFWVMGLFPIFLNHFFVFQRKNRFFASMTSLIELESSYLATMSYSRMLKSWYLNIWQKLKKSKMAAIFPVKITKNAIKTLFLLIKQQFKRLNLCFLNSPIS